MGKWKALYTADSLMASGTTASLWRQVCSQTIWKTFSVAAVSGSLLAPWFNLFSLTHFCPSFPILLLLFAFCVLRKKLINSGTMSDLGMLFQWRVKEPVCLGKNHNSWGWNYHQELEKLATLGWSSITAGPKKKKMNLHNLVEPMLPSSSLHCKQFWVNQFSQLL